MRKTIILATALTAALSLAACDSGDDAPAPSSVPATASVAASEPVADTEGEEPIDGPSVPVTDVTGLKVERASLTEYPDGRAVNVDFRIKNSATYAVTFAITLAIFDANGEQATAVGIDTGASSYGPTLPGKTLHVTGPYLAESKLPAGDFTAKVTEVKRQAV